MSKIIISIIIPVYNEEKFITRSLESLGHQTIGPQHFEIVVVDGGSDDNTKNLVSQWHDTHPEINLQLLDNPKRITPSAFNIGIENASGRYISLFGGHSTVENDFLEKIIDTFANHPEVDACGGVVRTAIASNSPQARLIAYIMKHPFGVGRGMRVPQSVREGYSSTVAKITYKKDVFQRVGLFDEDFVRTQDKEMNYRLHQVGGRIWLNPGIKTTYYTRPTIEKLFKTAFYNSYFLSYFLRKHCVFPELKYMVPAAFTLTLCSLLACSFFSLYGALALFTLLLIYFGTALFSSFSMPGKRLKDFVKLPIYFFGLHVCYGAGFIIGMLQVCFSGKRTKPVNTR